MRGKELNGIAQALLALLDALPEEKPGTAQEAEAAAYAPPAGSAQDAAAQLRRADPADAAEANAAPGPAAGEAFPAGQARSGTEPPLSAASPALREPFGGTDGSIPSRGAAVEELDRCFRRDSRRYDGGFAGE